MDVILMRHGRAGQRGDPQTDAQRPLTAEGRERLRRALPGLHQLVPHIERVVSSPLLRARQTAEVVAERYRCPLSELAALAPGGEPAAVTRWLGEQRAQTLLLVGHEPDLGRLASWYLTGSEESFLTMKKGAIGLIHFDGKPAVAGGELRLWLTAGQLSRLAR